MLCFQASTWTDKIMQNSCLHMKFKLLLNYVTDYSIILLMFIVWKSQALRHVLVRMHQQMSWVLPCFHTRFCQRPWHLVGRISQLKWCDLLKASLWGKQRQTVVTQSSQPLIKWCLKDASPPSAEQPTCHMSLLLKHQPKSTFKCLILFVATLMTSNHENEHQYHPQWPQGHW